MEDTHTPSKEKRQALQSLSLLFIIGSLFLVVLGISEIKQYGYIGAGVEPAQTVSISGEGEVFAIPDIATISVSVQEEGANVPEVQDDVNERNNEIVSFLEEQGIAEEDIQTTNYSISPRYEYRTEACIEGRCPPSGERVLAGYQVTQTLRVKVRDTDATGEILSGVGELGATNVQGPNFTVEDEETFRDDAREMAIDDAREKAEQLADDLGVDLVRIVNFSESGQYPYSARAEDSALGLGGGADGVATTPNVQTGQTRVTSNVTITYEIR